ncbi:CapA family protein [Staphylospora marina]|uniref:CapA family protein n=1 Tax=Staphylospora marina TaxID=2490858 RepID=UPI000F5BB010|nr:CapA family protein [Staphylospora marina]
MGTEITVSAVGDLLMRPEIIATARVSGGHDFDPLFKPVAPYLAADFSIGNLETTLSGPQAKFVPKSGGPKFNCPDSLAGTLKRLGFDVLTTANNHCLDCGIQGLRRTLDVLDRHGLAHTGTARSFAESRNLLIRNVKGIRIGTLAYTYGTNGVRPPRDQGWAVNWLNTGRIINDIRRMKAQGTDLVVVCLHFGYEYHLYPSRFQKNLVSTLFRHGADVILGAHPHVIQPAVFREVKDIHGVTKKRFAIYSLGNFISSRLYKNDHTLTGVIVRLKVGKTPGGSTTIRQVRFVPTWVHATWSGKRRICRVVPLENALKTQPPGPYKDRMLRMYRHFQSHIWKPV